MSETDPTVLVGVYPGQPDVVVQEAATFATRFGARLVCAYVNAERYVVEEYPGGEIRSLPIDPDLADDDLSDFPSTLASHLGELLTPAGVRWESYALAGEPARALDHLAGVVHASFIVIGTRRPGVRGNLKDFFGGSVAVHLAHRQHRPVVVVPVMPVPDGETLPWESAP